MEIKSNSWHWWMVKTFTNCETDYALRRLGNACAYRRKVCRAFLNALAATAMLSLIAYFLTSPIWAGIGYLLGMLTWTDPDGTKNGFLAMAIAAFAIWILAGLTALNALGVYAAIWKWISGQVGKIIPESWKVVMVEEPKEPGFLLTWYRDVKEKVCPTGLELVDAGRK